MDCRQARQAHTFSLYEAMQHVQNEAWLCPAEIFTDLSAKDFAFRAAYVFLKM